MSSKKWSGSPKVWILNDNGNREGTVTGWHAGYQMWLVKVESGHGKGTTLAFGESTLRRR